MKLIGYIRVSGVRQGLSGLGLSAQTHALDDYCRRNDGELIATYREVESGKGQKNRPQLLAAMAHAKRIGATLIVAKLDRLSRNALFLLTLQAGGVPFICCDNPSANPLTIQLLAIVADHEGKMISLRTKEALAAAKARGTLLGSARPGHWKGHEEAVRLGQAKGRATYGKNRHVECIQFAIDLRAALKPMVVRGLTQSEIAEELNAQGYLTRQGKPWNPVAVCRLLKRAELQSV